MAITINGNGTVTGVSVGGLPDGIVDTDMLAALAVSDAKIANTTITDGKIANTTISEGKLAANVNTITEADQWRIHTSLTGITSGTDLTSNFDRNDANFSKIGTGMSESSGIFTFPSTGIWMVKLQLYITSNVADNNWAGGNILISANSGSNWWTKAEGWTNLDGADGSTNNYGQTNTELIFDVTDASTHRVKFSVASDTTAVFHGGTDSNISFMTFLRLGDT